MKKLLLIVIISVFYANLFGTNSFGVKNLLLSNTPTAKEAQTIEKKPNLAIFDTSRREKYFYQPMIEIAKNANFDVYYYSIDKMIDTPVDKIPFKEIDCAFFVLCPEFLKSIKTSSIAEKILSIMNLFSKNENKMSVLMFPSLRLNHPDPFYALSPLFKNFQLVPKGRSHSWSMFRNLTNRFLQTPFEGRPLKFETSLRLEQVGRKNQNFGLNQVINSDTLPVALLPIKQNFSEKVKNFFPFGVYHFNNINKNHIVITSTGLLFSGISENFQICPMKFEVRKEMHSALNEFIWELNKIITQEKNIAGVDVKRIALEEKNRLPIEIISIGNLPAKKGVQPLVGAQPPIKVAWMDLNIFENQNKKNEQKKVIDFLLLSRFDHLWITLNPHMYYSPIGRSRSKKDTFFKSLSNFTKTLARESKKRNLTPPSILVGFEITNNIYKPNLPKETALDLYGNNYKDIPRPLDEKFWNEEIKKPLKAFLEKWNDEKMSNRIKISGIMLDLEMYCREVTGAFLPTMGFEEKTINNFLKPPFNKNLTPKIFTQNLIDNNSSKKYFDHLEKKATELGQDLSNFFRKELPYGIIGCYAPNISTDWFYKGFYSGLSTKENPLYLLTFNSEFYSHKKWLLKNNIQAHHLSVLMLSKIKNLKDISYSKEILDRHDGIWKNKIRVSQKKATPNDWWFLEKEQIPPKELMIYAKQFGKL